MNTQVLIALLALVCGIITIAVPNAMRFAVGGWMIIAGILWLIK